MKRILLAATLFISMATSTALADTATPAPAEVKTATSTTSTYGDPGNLKAPASFTGRDVAAGALSFLIWPGIGQAIQHDRGDKVLTHGLIGILPPFRFWSGYDALINRKSGYWNGRI